MSNGPLKSYTEAKHADMLKNTADMFDKMASYTVPVHPKHCGCHECIGSHVRSTDSCSRGRHEMEVRIAINGSETSVVLCKHCRCLYVEKAC